MNSKTSNTIFLGALALSAAVLGLVAAPAAASEAPAVTCVDSMCYALPNTDPILIAPLDPATLVGTSGTADHGIEAAPYRPADPTLGFELGTVAVGERDSVDAFIGSVDRRTDSGVPELLGDDARIPTNFQIEPVRSVAGLGLRSTF